MLGRGNSVCKGSEQRPVWPEGSAGGIWGIRLAVSEGLRNILGAEGRLRGFEAGG